MMMKNFSLFAIFAISCELLISNTVSAYPGRDHRTEDDKLHESCPKIDKGTATLLSHESDCTAYYMCQSGLAILKFCPHDLHFNPKKKVCDFPERAGCTLDEKEEVFRSAGIPHSDCPLEDADEPVLLKHESDCTKFYMCSHGLAYEKTCQFDLYFNAEFRVCDYPENVKCDLSFSEQKDDKQPKCPKINKSTATLLPHESDCTQYYICESGVPIVRFCPDDLHFNPTKMVCDFPERAGCPHKRDQRMKDENLHESCPRIDKGMATLLSHESDCTAYYMCQSGTAILKFCPHDLHFNPKKKVCDFPERAGCTLDEKEEVFRSSGIPHSDCPFEDADEPVLLKHESDCTMFYMCSHGLAYEKTCQFDLHFNAKLRVCDYPENAKCDLSEFHIQLAPPQATGSPSPFCPTINGKYPIFFPHPTNCSIYYMCGNGLAYEFTCPPGLHFNVRLKTCDFPSRAKCSQGF